MIKSDILWSVNIPQSLGLVDGALDDVDVDADGSIYISDGINGRVYKFEDDGSTSDIFSVIRPVSWGGEELSLNLAVAEDSSFYIADAAAGIVARYNEFGNPLGEFKAPGILSLCAGPEGLVYALSNYEGAEHIHVYDQIGSLMDTLPAPPRHRAYIDVGLVNMDSDAEGNVYVSYGMPPYRIWKVNPVNAEMHTWEKDMDYPEDAVLISDITVDHSTGILWVLLAFRRAGRQVLDAFSPNGEFLGTMDVPHAENLYGVICSSIESRLFLLNTSTGPGGGDLICFSIAD